MSWTALSNELQRRRYAQALLANGWERVRIHRNGRTRWHWRLKRQPPKRAQPALLDWALEQWNQQVKHRPLVNVHRRSLDGAWRQVIRFAGGDPVMLVGPPHDELVGQLDPDGGSAP